MFELVATTALSAQLAEARDQLRTISTRVEAAGASAPRRDASGWEGLAAEAYQFALNQLMREVSAAEELVRSAADLIGAAVFELGSHA